MASRQRTVVEDVDGTSWLHMLDKVADRAVGNPSETAAFLEQMKLEIGRVPTPERAAHAHMFKRPSVVRFLLHSCECEDFKSRTLAVWFLWYLAAHHHRGATGMADVIMGLLASWSEVGGACAKEVNGVIVDWVSKMTTSDVVEEMTKRPAALKKTLGHLEQMFLEHKLGKHAWLPVGYVVALIVTRAPPGISVGLAAEMVGRSLTLVDALVKAGLMGRATSMCALGTMCTTRPQTVVSRLLKADVLLDLLEDLTFVLSGKINMIDVDTVSPATHIVCALHEFGRHAGRVLVRTCPTLVEAMRQCARPREPAANAAAVRVLQAIDERMARVCASCGMTEDGSGRVRFLCEGCCRAAYCGKACQRTHWVGGHRSECCWKRQHS